MTTPPRPDWNHNPPGAELWDALANGTDHLANATDAAAHVSTATNHLRETVRGAALAGHTPDDLATATGLPLTEVHRIILSD